MPNIRTPELSQRQQSNIDTRVEDGLKRIVSAYTHLMQADDTMTQAERETLKDSVRAGFLANS